MNLARRVSTDLNLRDFPEVFKVFDGATEIPASTVETRIRFHAGARRATVATHTSYARVAFPHL